MMWIGPDATLRVEIVSDHPNLDEVLFKYREGYDRARHASFLLGVQDELSETIETAVDQYLRGKGIEAAITVA
jgi:hypothetical protein